MTLPKRSQWNLNALWKKKKFVDVIEELLKEDEEDESTMVKRPPLYVSWDM